MSKSVSIRWPIRKFKLILQRTCVNELEKWLQLLFIRWYRSPRNWFPISSMIRLTSSSLKSVQPIWMLCLIFPKQFVCIQSKLWIHILRQNRIKNTLPESKLFAKFIMITRTNFKYTSEWKGMSTICKFTTINFHTRMIDANPQICCVFIDPILNINGKSKLEKKEHNVGKV